MRNDIILGGGLSGLIWAVYHPNSVIVEPGELGGTVHKNMGPMMIHHTPEVAEFIRKIGLPAYIKTVNVGYTRDLDHFTSEPPDAEFRADYYRNSRRLSSRIAVPRSTMSGGSSSFIKIDHPAEEIIEKTIKYLQTNGTIFIKGRVEEVFYSEPKVIVNRQEIVGNRVISTIPMTIFQGLIHESLVKPANGLTKVFIDTGLTPSYQMKDFDYVYVVDYTEENLTRLVIGKTVVEEFTIPLNEDPEYILESRKSVRNSVLKGTIRINKDINRWRHVKFVGRTARWDHNIKVNNVIEEAQKDVE